MTNKEALKIVDECIEEGKIVQEAFNYSFLYTVQEALEKQIPKKRIWGRTATRPNVTWICPCCRNHVNSEFCRKCGQAIDWSEVENEIENDD